MRHGCCQALLCWERTTFFWSFCLPRISCAAVSFITLKDFANGSGYPAAPAQGQFGDPMMVQQQAFVPPTPQQQPQLPPQQPQHVPPPAPAPERESRRKRSPSPRRDRDRDRCACCWFVNSLVLGPLKCGAEVYLGYYCRWVTHRGDSTVLVMTRMLGLPLSMF